MGGDTWICGPFLGALIVVGADASVDVPDGSVDVVNGYECSGNSGRAMQGLSSNGRFTGVRVGVRS